MSENTIQYDVHLHVAIAQGDIEWAKLALQFGASPNCCDENGNTALHLAVNSKETWQDELVQKLLEEGADPFQENDNKLTPIDLAQETEQWELALKMASYKIDK